MNSFLRSLLVRSFAFGWLSLLAVELQEHGEAAASQGSRGCFCEAKVSKRILVSEDSKNEADCFSRIERAMLDGAASADACGPNGDDEIYVQWRCEETTHSSLWNRYFLNCRQAGDRIAKRLLLAVDGLSGLAGKRDGVFPQITSPCPREVSVRSVRPLVDGASGGLQAEKIRMHFDSLEELRSKLGGFIPGEVLDRPKDKWQFSFALPNDNKGMGLLDHLFYRNIPNDTGATHGLRVSLSKGVDKGYHVTFEYQTNLYTALDTHAPYSQWALNPDGTYNVNQHFLEDNLLKVLFDTKDQGKAEYFKAGVGWHQINEEKLGNVLVSSARQQKDFHALLGRNLAAQYNYLGGKGVRNGLYLETGTGRQKTHFSDDQYRVSSNLETTAAFSGADQKADFVQSRAEVKFDYQASSQSMAYRASAGATAKVYNDSRGVRFSRDVSVTLGGEKLQCGASLLWRKTDFGAEYVKYDLDSEELMTMFCNRNF